VQTLVLLFPGTALGVKKQGHKVEQGDRQVAVVKSRPIGRVETDEQKEKGLLRISIIESREKQSTTGGEKRKRNVGGGSNPSFLVFF